MTTESAQPGLPASRLRAVADSWFALDLRSIALFRVALAAVILGDLYWRARDIGAFYTDAGIMPRTAWHDYYRDDPWHWSLHLLGGSWGFEAGLFAIAAIAGVMLLVGWHTRIAAIVTWAMLVSVQARDPLCLQGGDILLRCLAFWGMLLPLGAVFSLDRARSTSAPPPTAMLAPAGAGIVVQMSLLYWCSSLLKFGAEWHGEGTAVWYALALDQFATGPGKWLRAHPDLCAVMTHVTMIVEGWGPGLLVLPAMVAVFSARAGRWLAGWTRLAAVALFVGFHLGLGLCMELGPFPWVAIAGWLALVPGRFWSLAAWRAQPITIAYDGACGFCKSCVRLLATFGAVPRLSVMRCQDDPVLDADMRALDSWVVVDGTGARHHRFAAVAVVMAHSRLWFWVAPILRLPPLMRLGTAAYRWVASHRMQSARWFRWLRPAPLRVWLPAWPQLAVDVVTCILITYVVLWNARSLHDKPAPVPTAPLPLSERLISPFALAASFTTPYPVAAAADASKAQAGGPSGTGETHPPEPPLDFAHFAERWFPTGENWVLVIPALDQYWNMFSPMPLRDDGWYVMIATDASGQAFDLLTGVAPVDREPDDVAGQYPDERWRKFLMNLASDDFKRWRIPYAKWAFTQWNREHPERQIKSLTVRYWKKTNTFGQAPVISLDELAKYP